MRVIQRFYLDEYFKHSFKLDINSNQPIRYSGGKQEYRIFISPNKCAHYTKIHFVFVKRNPVSICKKKNFTLFYTFDFNSNHLSLWNSTPTLRREDRNRVSDGRDSFHWGNIFWARATLYKKKKVQFLYI